jgi:phosphoadenosine phosphosulfate reductase
MKQEITEQDEKLLKGLSAEEVLQWSSAKFRDGIVFSSSMGLEDQVLTDMIFRLGLDIEIFTLDTGRLFNETYKLIEDTEKRYGVKVKIYFPQASAVEDMVNNEGINLFYKSSEQRKKCCHVRKIEPLQRALSKYSAWICGLRREQSVTRGDILMADWDEGNQMIKINPLAEWREQDV